MRRFSFGLLPAARESDGLDGPVLAQNMQAVRWKALRFKTGNLASRQATARSWPVPGRSCLLIEAIPGASVCWAVRNFPTRRGCVEIMLILAEI